MDKNYKLKNGDQFHFHEREEGYEYTYYNERGKEIDGGIFEYDWEKEKNLPEWEVIELLANFADLPELLEEREEIEEIVEKPTYHIKIWETEEDREEGMPEILEIGFTNMLTAVKRAKEIWQDNDFASLEVQTEIGYEEIKVIYFCDNTEEKYVDVTRHYVESQREDMITIFKEYHNISPEITSKFGMLYIVHEIENRFFNNPELYDRFSQKDKETIFEQSYEAWVQAESSVSSYTIVNKILDAVTENRISIKGLEKLSSSDILDVIEEVYDFEDLEDEESRIDIKDIPLTYEELVDIANRRNNVVEEELENEM